MKYFLFNKDYPYYALIVAPNEEVAIKEYMDVVCDLDEDGDEDLSPKELSIDEVLAEIEKSSFESEQEKDEIISKVKMGLFGECEVLLIDTTFC